LIEWKTVYNAFKILAPHVLNIEDIVKNNANNHTVAAATTSNTTINDLANCNLTETISKVANEAEQVLETAEKSIVNGVEKIVETSKESLKSVENKSESLINSIKRRYNEITLKNKTLPNINT